jgi:hypothetical protein
MFAADAVALCWSLGFSRSPMCIHVHTYAFDNIYSDLRRIFWSVAGVSEGCVCVCVGGGVSIRDKMFPW